ncbi:MAG: NAD(P)H-hydrate dehydratase [Anaerolineae bacterium]|nr:NAD(P)H-hydrate dehydratase [Anaerolineae bacterium]
MKLVTADQMRALEQRADASGNTYAMMMERAGRAVADAILARFDARDLRVLVLVGPGNNGGDGLVCARYLHDAGARVALHIWKRAERADDENFRLCRERNIPTIRAEDDANFVALKDFLADANVIVDALLGTGVARPIEGLLKDLLVFIKTQSPNHPITQLVPTRSLAHTLSRSLARAPSRSFARALSRTIVAVDLPSGLDPNTGALDPATLDADLTVTFAFPKIGQLAFPGANAVGELVVADIGIAADWAPPDAPDVATAREIAARLPARARDAHKGTFGKAMICAGSSNYVGAAYLAGAAATRAGAGLVTLALACTIYPMIASALHETTFVILPDDNGALVPDSARVLLDHLAGYDALLLGCGFGRHPQTIAFVTQILNHKSQILNCVIDADALFALAQIGDWWTRLAPNTAILTPHPGEMATLTGLQRDTIQADRVNIAKKFAAQWQQIVVLKGAFTVIAAPDGRATLLPFATPALATAGTGDVLAGTIVAMLAQGLNPYDAAIVGAYLHGLAGEIAAREIGDAGVVASDVLVRLPEAMRRVKREGE